VCLKFAAFQKLQLTGGKEVSHRTTRILPEVVLAHDKNVDGGETGADHAYAYLGGAGNMVSLAPGGLQVEDRDEKPEEVEADEVYRLIIRLL
jgi:hypothetical protein